MNLEPKHIFPVCAYPYRPSRSCYILQQKNGDKPPWWNSQFILKKWNSKDCKSLFLGECWVLLRWCRVVTALTEPWALTATFLSTRVARPYPATPWRKLGGGCWRPYLISLKKRIWHGGYFIILQNASAPALLWCPVFTVSDIRTKMWRQHMLCPLPLFHQQDKMLTAEGQVSLLPKFAKKNPAHYMQK